MQWIIDHWQEIAFAVTATVTAASAFTALTPSPKDDAWLAKVRKLVDLLALNVKNARSK